MQKTIQRWRLATILLSFLCGPAFAAAPGAIPAPATPAALRSALIAAMDDHQVPGASYAVFDRDGTVLSDTIGLRNAASKTPVTPSTLFRMGSITKTVTAIAIMQLVERGRFSLQTPVSQLLPAAPIRNGFEKTEPVRVLHLLSHSAGFDDTHAKGFFAATEPRGGHLAALLANPEPLTVRWQPGTVQSYSNPGYWLLGAILEAQYGQPWEAIVRSRVLLPLGMTATVALSSDALLREHADGHSGYRMAPTSLPFEPAQAHGALWTTAQDLAKLGRFLLTDGASAPAVLRPETLRLMKQPQGSNGSRAGLDYGNGLGTRTRAVANARWQGHSGGVMGALASMHFHAQKGMGYVVLVNSENALRPLEKPLAAYIGGQTGWQAPPVNLQPAAMDAAGWYRTVNPRVSLMALPTFLLSTTRVSVDGATVHLTPPLPGFGTEGTLKHRGNGLLADIDDGEVITGMVLRDAGGAVSALDLDGSYLQRTSAIAVLLPLASVLLALPLLLSVPFGRRRVLVHPWSRRLPTISLLVLVAGVICAANLKLHLLGEINWQTVGIAIATTLFPLLALVSVAVNLRNWRTETARVAKWRCMLGALGALVIAGWLAAFKLAGFALWLW